MSRSAVASNSSRFAWFGSGGPTLRFSQFSFWSSVWMLSCDPMVGWLLLWIVRARVVMSRLELLELYVMCNLMWVCIWIQLLRFGCQLCRNRVCCERECFVRSGSVCHGLSPVHWYLQKWASHGFRCRCYSVAHLEQWCFH